jgi:uncharacterized protein (DUF1015 family)
VVCPPYDIISPAEAETLRRRDPHNAVNLELAYQDPTLARGADLYVHTAALFRDWLERGVLVRDTQPSMYVLEEEFCVGGGSYRRRSVIAAVQLEDFQRAVIVPHERTHAAPVSDRFLLLSAAHCNFSPLMALYRDTGGAVDSLLEEAVLADPEVEIRLNGSYACRVWAVSDPSFAADVSAAMAPLKVYIADGHHRYEAALRYRDAQRGAGTAARYVLMGLIPMADPGLLLLAHHRLIGGLSEPQLAGLRRVVDRVAVIERLVTPDSSAEGTAAAIESRLAAHPPDEPAIAAYGLEPGEAHIVTARSPSAGDGPALERSDTWALHATILGPALGAERERDAVSFVQDAVEAVRRVQEGRSQVAFMLRPLSMDLFEEIAGAGTTMPAKSTCFSPKLPTGLVMNSLEGDL